VRGVGLAAFLTAVIARESEAIQYAAAKRRRIAGAILTDWEYWIARLRGQ